eukprot:2389097-Amphidinium_carterae.1
MAVAAGNWRIKKCSILNHSTVRLQLPCYIEVPLQLHSQRLESRIGPFVLAALVYGRNNAQGTRSQQAKIESEGR